MANSKEILEEVKGYPPRERAAALAHWVYVTTAKEIKTWNARVPEKWEQLSPEARAFNLASIDTWAVMEDITEAWTEALKAVQQHSIVK